MKIVFFGNAPEKIAAIRYRIQTFARMLEAEGHTCVVCLPSSVALQARLYDNKSRASKLFYLFLVWLRRWAQLRHVPGADVVYFRGSLFLYGPPLFERIARLLNPRLIFDIDDAVWEPPDYVDSPFVRFIDFDWVPKMARICRHAVVGNEYLAQHVRTLMPCVTIIPTCIDLDKHTPKEIGAIGPIPSTVTLGWTGLHTNLGYLDHIAPVIQELAAKYPIRMVVATGRPYHLDGVEVENHAWTLAHEIDYLRAADIGLMPLEDSPCARGKCAFKALQYMGVGVPVVLSPVGMNVEAVEDGVSGFFADTPEEWREKLERLIADPGLRLRMGQAARERVAERYSHAVNYPVLKRVLEAVAQEKQPPC